MKVQVSTHRPYDQDALWVGVRKYDEEAKTAEYAILQRDGTVTWHEYQAYEVLRPFVVIPGRSIYGAAFEFQEWWEQIAPLLGMVETLDLSETTL